MGTTRGFVSRVLWSAFSNPGGTCTIGNVHTPASRHHPKAPHHHAPCPSPRYPSSASVPSPFRTQLQEDVATTPLPSTTLTRISDSAVSTGSSGRIAKFHQIDPASTGTAFRLGLHHRDCLPDLQTLVIYVNSSLELLVSGNINTYLSESFVGHLSFVYNTCLPC